MRHVLYFTADWCNPCKRTKPFADELVSEGENIKFIDADSEPEMIKNFKVLSVPTFILIENESEIKRMNGAKTKEELYRFIHEE